MEVTMLMTDGSGQDAGVAEKVNKLRGDRGKLIAPRESVYSSELEAKPIAGTEIEEMKSVIAGKNVAVIDGPVIYAKFVAVVREKEIPSGHLGSANLDSMVRRVYGDLVRGNGKKEV